MPPATDPVTDIPANYVLDILGNVLFLQVLRGLLADTPVQILNAPEVNFRRIVAFFQQVAMEFDLKILNGKGESLNSCKVTLDYKTKKIVATAFPEEFYAEEETLIQRLRENPNVDSVILQLKNLLAKVNRIRVLYSQSPIDARQDPKKFYAIVQKNFRQAPVSHEFVQFIVDNRNMREPRSSWIVLFLLHYNVKHWIIIIMKHRDSHVSTHTWKRY